MTFPTLNCLSTDQTLESLHAVEHFRSIDVSFCRDASQNADGSEIEQCAPDAASFATIYGINDFGEAVAIHDADLTANGAGEVAQITAKMFEIIITKKAG